ncbi:MAG: long-chain fatty acid--CoA ligase [Pyrinomonadaceae bacterium]|nr:long-chain fatty acid--CoA ligase [Pyrinomonadaceae bacterium]
MNNSPTILNLASLIRHHARLTPESEAVVWKNVRLNYGQLEALSNQTANALVKLGIGRGDKVALSCPNLPYFPIVYYAILKVGAAVVPLNLLFKKREVAYHLSDSDAKAVFVFEGTDELPMAQMVKEGFDQAASCEHLIVMMKDPSSESPYSEHPTLHQLTAKESIEFDVVPTLPDDTCAILYTSGTTGTPKGAELTHSNIIFNAIASFNLHVPGLDYTNGEQKTCLITLPLFHTTGQTAQMNAQIFAGHRIVLLPRFDAQTTLETFKNEKINFWTGVPTMYWAILKYVEENNIDVAPYAESLNILSSGGAPMPVEVMTKFEKLFNCRILEGYGLSETSPITTFNHPTARSKPGTVGQPLFGLEVKCVDDDDNEVPTGERGEIVMRGHNIMKGYYKRPDATAEAFRNGWFHSGDIGVMDEDGFLSIVDRKKDMILRGGFNIYPRELEEVIMTHPAVSLVAVIGTPCDKMGEDVKAFIVKKQGAEITEDEMIAWCKEQFAAYKYPRFVEFRDELPVGGTGKILKRALKEEIESENV